MKRTIHCILVILVTGLILLSATNVHAFEPLLVDLDEFEKQVFWEYLEQEEFQMMLEETPLEAIEMIERIAHGKMVPTSGTPGNAACYVKLVPQIKTWWCGYATTLQTIYGLGLQGTVVGSTDAQKQTTIANEMGNPNDTAYVYKIVNYLNSKLSSSKYYYTLGSGQTKQSLPH